MPLDATRPLKLLLVNIAGDPDAQPGRFFENELRCRVDSLETLRFDTRYSPIGTLDLSKVPAYDAVILALFVRVADRKGSVALPEEQASAVHRLFAIDKPVIVACFGSPYVIKHFPEAKTWVGVFSNADVAQRAAARAIFGQAAISGRIPVNVPGAVPIGAGMVLPANPMKLTPPSDPSEETRAKFASACALLDRAIADRAYPGGVLAVGYKGELFTHAFGRQTYAAHAASVNEKTIYDTASLTKPVVYNHALRHAERIGATRYRRSRRPLHRRLGLRTRPRAARARDGRPSSHPLFGTPRSPGLFSEAQKPKPKFSRALRPSPLCMIPAPNRSIPILASSCWPRLSSA